MTRDDLRMVGRAMFVGALLCAGVGCSSAPDAAPGASGVGEVASDATTTQPASAPTSTTTIVTALPSTTTLPASALPSTTTIVTAPPATTVPSDGIAYVVPVTDVAAAGWSDTHSAYPATDIFLECGSEIVSPVGGVVLHVRTVDSWDPDVDDPATRGGRSVAVLGDDGARYYLAHFDEIEPSLAPDDRVDAGQRLGTMGETGRTSACHAHFGISPPCPEPEWSVRRGVIWPAPYLDAWRRSEQVSPAAEVEMWVAQNPDACSIAAADPNAAAAG